MNGWLDGVMSTDLRPTLAALSFLAPGWAWALAGAVAVPLIAHLLSRRGGRVFEFPATRFVQQAVSDTARMLRPRHWLLMLLRIAALALLVGAFMQPVWLDAVPLGRGERGLMVTLLVDRSASMTRTAGGASLFDEARRRALATLDALDPARDRASVILIDAKPRPLLPEPSANFSALRDRLQDAEATHERGDAAAALDEALRHAAEDEAEADRARHIELFTDAQATTWPGDALASAEARGAAVRVHRIHGPAANVALRRPLVEPTTPIAGQRALASVEVANLSDEPRDVTVRFVNDTTAPPRTLRLDAGAAIRLAWSWTPDATGAHTLRFAITQDDALGLDDRVGRVVDVAGARPVSLLTKSDPQDPHAAAYFVSRALVPGDQAATGIAFGTIRPEAAPDALRDGMPGTWFLVEARELPDEAIAAVREHLAAGGGVVWVIDSAEAAAQLDALPAELRVITPEAWRADTRPIAAARFDDPLLTVFEGAARAGLIDQPVRASLQGTLTPAAEPLLLFEDGRPAAATRWVGAGRIAMIGFPLDEPGSDLPKGPAFVGLMQQLAHRLTPGRPPQPNPHPGDVVGETTARRVGLLTGSDDPPTPRAWVELHPEESDLRAAEARDADDDTDAAATADTAAAPPLRRDAEPLWPWLVLGALGLLIAEGLLLLAWSRRVLASSEPMGEVMHA